MGGGGSGLAEDAHRHGGRSLASIGIAVRVVGAGRVVSPEGAASYRLPAALSRDPGRGPVRRGRLLRCAYVWTATMVPERRRSLQWAGRRPDGGGPPERYR